MRWFHLLGPCGQGGEKLPVPSRSLRALLRCARRLCGRVGAAWEFGSCKAFALLGWTGRISTVLILRV